MIYVTKQMSFSASHRIYNPSLSDEENFRLFNQCANKNGHGHNFTIEVTVKGNINPLTGFVINLKELKDIMQEHLISLLDHSNLNLDIEFFKHNIPTSENIAIFAWNILEDKIKNAKLYKIKIAESNSSYVEYFGNSD